MKVAIIHYWLVGMRGGERVLERLCLMYPEADIYTHVWDPERTSKIINGMNIYTTFIGKLPFARRIYQVYLPLMPIALEGLDMTKYDLVIALESGPTKGVITRPDAVSVCYCFSPMRYLWDQYHIYRKASGILKRMIMPWLMHYLRIWDSVSAVRVDRFAADSEYVKRRLAKAYGRDAAVIYPPVAVTEFSIREPEEYFLWVGQFVPYKRPDVVVEAFNESGRKLIMIGDGSELKSLKAIARDNIRFIERATFEELKAAYAHAKALVFTAEEDFGIVPLEAMASGRPVIAYGRGGALETVVDGRTGLFYYEHSPAALNAAVAEFERWLPTFEPDAAVLHAGKFSQTCFDDSFRAFVDGAIADCTVGSQTRLS